MSSSDIIVQKVIYQMAKLTFSINDKLPVYDYMICKLIISPFNDE